MRPYALGLGPNDVLARSNAAGTARTTFIPDILGSVVGTLDSGTGLLTKAGFQTFGESTAANGAFRYTGAHLDAETGLYDFRARIYAPKLGRFMQADPIGYADGVNLYAYVNNDPLNLVDPSGFVAEGFMAGVSNAMFGTPISAQLQNGSFAFMVGAFVGEVVTPVVALFAGERLIAGASKVLAPAVGATARIAAPQTAPEFVNLANSQRTTHILTGDATGGGHLFPGAGGKSAFPQSWSAERIMHEISDDATDPLSSFVVGRNGRTIVNGTRDGIDIRVIVGAPREGAGIITGYPTNVPRNP